MFTRRIFVVVLLGLGASLAGAAELVGVPGSTTRYPSLINARVGDREVPLVLTGTALRTKLLFSVYTVASYVREGVSVRTAEELIAADCPKQLHLVMERDVGGKDLGEAIEAAIRLNHPAPAFDAELHHLTEYLKPLATQKGDHVVLTHVPGVGLHFILPGKADTTIANVAFAQAVWEIYFGKKNLGEDIKRGLLSHH